MSMEDILKVLVNSRQQGNSSTQNSDPMTDIIGGLLGAQQPQAPASGQQQSGLGNMMGMLEMFMGGNQPGSMNQASAGNAPIMMLLQPFVAKLAKKMNIPPEIAMVVVSLVAHKLLAHYPTSGRDSNSFDLDDMLTQMNSGKVNSDMLYNSGMVREVSQRTGMNEADAEKTLSSALAMFGKQVKSGAKSSASPRQKAPAASRGSLRSAGVRGGKVKR